MKDTNSLSHTSYRCKYHIVMVPKYRRVVIYNKLRADIIEIIKILVNRKPDLKIIEGEACPDHIHLLIEIPPKYSVSEIMGYLKSKSILMIFDIQKIEPYHWFDYKYYGAIAKQVCEKMTYSVQSSII